MARPTAAWVLAALLLALPGWVAAQEIATGVLVDIGPDDKVQLALGAANCDDPVDAGPCRAAFTRWAYDKKKGSCVQFYWGGCQANGNNFETPEDCTAVCGGPAAAAGVETAANICTKPIDAGTCRAAFQRWAFDAKQGQCVQFFFGGCNGNENNFESQSDCQAVCGGGSEVGQAGANEPRMIDLPKETGLAERCMQPKKVGPCRARIEAYYFDRTTHKCKKFFYGGCEGNDNNFATKVQCEVNCRPRPRCFQPQEAGPCMAYVPSWYYDVKDKKCKKFVYGGCQGNRNRFETKEHCMKACQRW